MLIVSVFSLRAQEFCSRVKIEFPYDSDSLMVNYRENATMLSALDTILAKQAQIEKIVITSFSSPEGRLGYNRALSEKRALAAEQYLLSIHPELSGRITRCAREEAWEDLRSAVAEDENLANVTRNAVLEIIDSDTTPDEKETLMSRLPNFRNICLRYFKALRYAVVQVRFDNSLSIVPVPEENEIAGEIENVIEQQEEVKENTEDSAAEAAQEVTLTQTAQDATPTYTKAPLFALTNNFLYEAAGAAVAFHTVPLTVGYEIPVGRHWSIYSDYTVTVPWHAWNNNSECAELMHWDLGTRWYPWSRTRVLKGWYASLSAGAGYYDFQRNGNGYQGEEILGSLGVGYSLCFNDHWSLNFGLGAGPMLTRYRYYEGRSNNEHLVYRYSGTFTYFGVTDAKVTLTYLFYYKKRNRK